MKLDIAFRCPKCGRKLFIYDKNNNFPISKKDINHISCSWCKMKIDRIKEE